MFKKVKFEDVEVGTIFWDRNGWSYTKIKPDCLQFSPGCGRCGMKQVWNADNGNNTVHFCPGDEVEVMDEVE